MSAIPLTRRRLAGVASALFLATFMPSAWAGADLNQSAAAGGAAVPAIAAAIHQLDDALLRIMKAGKATPFQERVRMVAPAIEQALDLPYILRLSVGPSWGSMTADQQASLLQAFRTYTFATYVDNFDSYEGQSFVIAPTTRPIGDSQQLVETKLIPKSGSPHTLDYVMRQVGGTWKAVDVMADGSISRVAVQRSDFRQVLQQGGASALVARLQNKAAALARG